MSKSMLRTAFAVVLLAVGGAAVAANAPKVSEANAKTLKAAQDALQAKKYDEAVAKANEAIASGKATKDDLYTAHYMKFKAYEARNDYANMIKGLSGQLDSGFLPASDHPVLMKAIVTLAYNIKDFDTTIDYGSRLTKANAADQQTYTLVGQSYYQKKNYGEAASFLGSLVNDQEKRGQKPTEQNLKLIRVCYDRLSKEDDARDILEKLVVHYPKPEYWNELLYKVRRDPKLSERQTLQVYRLMQDTRTLQQGADFIEMSDIAGNVGIPGEAQRVLDEGVKAKAFTDEAGKARSERLLASATKRATDSRNELGKLEGEAKAAASGELDTALGMAQFGFGQYDKAAEALGRALTKGKVPNAEDVQLTLAIAQLRSGSAGEALKTMRAIKTQDPLMQRIVRLWVLKAS